MKCGKCGHEDHNRPVDVIKYGKVVSVKYTGCLECECEEWEPCFDEDKSKEN